MIEFASAEVAVISNGLGGLGFLCLTLFLVVGWRGRTEGALLALACGLNALWCGVIIAALLWGIAAPLLELAETIRDGAWLLFVAWMLPARGLGVLRRVLRWPAIALPAALAVFFLVGIWIDTPGGGFAPFVFVAGVTAMSLWMLILLEQLFRNAGPESRWGLKYICVAIGMLFAYDFFMYSYSLLYERIPPALWGARGAVNAFVVPLIAVSAARNPAWSLDVHMSRRAVFQSGALIACGGYLLLMAFGGYFVRNLGGTWGGFLWVLFCAASILLLLVLLLSSQVRSRLKVFINKHFFSYKYDYREEWLGLTRRLSNDEEAADAYQRSVKAVAHILDSPGGALWLQRDGAYVGVTNWNIPMTDDPVPPDDSLVSFLRAHHWIVDLNEYQRNPAHYGGLVLPEWLSGMPRARLIIPFVHEQGLLGFMLLAAPRASYDLSWEELDLLKTVGTQVGSFLGQQESNQALAQARQFEAFNRLTAFLMHDLKNIMAQQSLIIKNAAKHKTNPVFVDDMIMTVDSSVKRMKRLLEQLQRTTAQGDNSRRTEVGRVLQQVLEQLRPNSPEPRLAVDQAEAFVHLDPERFSMVLGHVIRNAQEATGAKGRVDVRVAVHGPSVRIEIEDDGPGMDPAFVRESLFRPFYTTKSSRGMGIGAYQAREFVRAAGGDVEVASEPGAGTVFAIVLPALSSVDNKEDEAVQSSGEAGT